MNVCKAWLNSSEGAEQVSSSREKFLKELSEDQVPSKYQVPSRNQVLSELQVPSDVQMPSISKIANGSWVTQWVPSTSIFNSVELLHYLKSHRFARFKLTWLLHWILWMRWKIMMMTWWHRILCRTFLGEYSWIIKEVSRENKFRGIYNVSYLIHRTQNWNGRIEREKVVIVLLLKNS